MPVQRIKMEVSRIEIERSKNSVQLFIKTARPVIIGQDGERVETLKKKLEKIIDGKDYQ